MPDDPTTPEGRQLTLRARDVWDAIEHLRSETREARHAQANQTTIAIAGLRTEMDTRLRSIEAIVSASNPTTIGPRLNEVEKWQARAEIRDSEHTQRATHRDQRIDAIDTRLDGFEAWKNQASGAWKLVTALSVVLGMIAAALGVFAAMNVAQ